MDLTRRRGQVVWIWGRLGGRKAALYEIPFCHVAEYVRPERRKTSAEGSGILCSTRLRGLQCGGIDQSYALHCAPRVAKPSAVRLWRASVFSCSAVIAIARERDRPSAFCTAAFTKRGRAARTSLEDRPAHADHPPRGLASRRISSTFQTIMRDPRAIAIAETARH